MGVIEQTAGSASLTPDVGIGTAAPLSILHIQEASLGVTAAMFSASTDGYIAVEAEDARLGLFSKNEGGHGSTVVFAEVTAGVYGNQWAIGRASSGSGSALYFDYGTNPDYSLNTRMLTYTTAGLFCITGGTPFVGIGTSAPLTRLHIAGLTGQDVILANDGTATSVGWGINAGTDILFSSAPDISSTFTEKMRLTQAGILKLPVNGPTGGVLIGTDVDIFRVDTLRARSSASWEAKTIRANGDAGGIATQTSLTNATDTPTTDPGWTSSSTVNMNAPDGYIKMFVGTQAVTVPYWNT